MNRLEVFNNTRAKLVRLMYLIATSLSTAKLYQTLLESSAELLTMVAESASLSVYPLKRFDDIRALNPGDVGNLDNAGVSLGRGEERGGRCGDKSKVGRVLSDGWLLM